MPSEIILHGNFVSVFGVGTLIMGEPGIGKSELALGLIQRQHQLIADDAPLFFRNGLIVMGKNPLKHQHFISIRGIGLFDVPVLFGPSSVQEQHPLDLIIKLQATKTIPTSTSLTPEQTAESILECLIPSITIPIISKRNLEAIVETLVKNFLVTRNMENDPPLMRLEQKLQKKMELDHL